MQINTRPQDPAGQSERAAHSRTARGPRVEIAPVATGGAMPVVLFILITAAFLGFHLAQFRPALTGPDAHGYFLQTRLLAETGSIGFTPASPVQYVGAHWFAADSNLVRPVYGPGLPLLLLPGFLVGGVAGALATNIALAVLALVALFLFLRRQAGGWWGVAGAVVFAVLPVFNEQVHWGGAHVAVACLLLWGLVLLARWAESGGVLSALFAGLLFGAIPAVRYPEAVLLVGMLFWLVAHLGGGRRWGLSAVVALLGAAVPLGLLAFYNRQVYGGWLATGYAHTGEQAAFALAHVSRNVLPYLRKLVTDGAGPAAIVGAPGMVALWFARGQRRLGVLLFILALAPLAVYTAYYWPPDPMSMRFLLPTLPLYVAGAMLLGRLVTGRSRAAGVIAGAVLVLLTCIWGAPGAVRRVTALSRQGADLLETGWLVDRHVPEGAVLAAGGEEPAQFDFIGRWRLADLSLTAPRGGPGGPAGPGGGQDARPRVRNPLASEYAEAVGPEALLRFARDCSSWAGDSGESWWLVPAEPLELMRAMLVGTGELVEVGRVEPTAGDGGPAGGRLDLPGAGPLVLCRYIPSPARAR